MQRTWRDGFPTQSLNSGWHRSIVLFHPCVLNPDSSFLTSYVFISLASPLHPSNPYPSIPRSSSFPTLIPPSLYPNLFIPRPSSPSLDPYPFILHLSPSSPRPPHSSLNTSRSLILETNLPTNESLLLLPLYFWDQFEHSTYLQTTHTFTDTTTLSYFFSVCWICYFFPFLSPVKMGSQGKWIGLSPLSAEAD